MNSKSFKIDSKGTPSSLPGICWICHQTDTPISKPTFHFPNFFFQKEKKEERIEIIQKSEKELKNGNTADTLEKNNEATKNSNDQDNNKEKVVSQGLLEKNENNEKNENEKHIKDEDTQNFAAKVGIQYLKKRYDQTFEDPNKKFRPCLCKGSLGNVHPECLNAWALKKYQTYINLFSENEESILFENEGVARNEFKIKCPNCKYALKYEVHERKVFKGISSFKFDSNEKITLFLLILFQSLFVYYDLRSLYYEKVEQRSFTENISHILYIFTVCVILSAGTFNFVDLFGREMVVEVENMEN